MRQKQIQIPVGWNECKLMDVADVVTGSTPDKSVGEYFGKDYPFYKPGDLDAGDIISNSIDGLSKLGIEKARLIPKNSILVVCIASLGKTSIIEKSGATNQQINAVIPNIDKISTKFLFYLIKSQFFQQQMIDKSSTGNMPNLSKTKFQNLKIVFPKDLNMQKKIVQKLDHVFLQINEKKKQILELQENNEERIRLMQLESNRAILQYFIPMEIPANWHRKKLSELAKVGQGGTPSRANPSYWNGDIPWLSSGEVLDKIILNSRERITEDGFSSKFKNKFPKGTILLAMTGQGRTRGRTALLEIEATTNQSCAHIINTSNEILTEFLWEFLKSRYWFIRSIKYGGGQPGINTTLIKELDISYPSKPEQEQILKKIANMGRMIPNWKKSFEEVLAQIDSNVKQLEHIPTQILDKAFSGKLTN